MPKLVLTPILELFGQYRTSNSPLYPSPIQPLALSFERGGRMKNFKIIMKSIDSRPKKWIGREKK